MTSIRSCPLDLIVSAINETIGALRSSRMRTPCAAHFLPDSIALDAAVEASSRLLLLLFRTSSPSHEMASAQGKRMIYGTRMYRGPVPTLTGHSGSILALNTTSVHPLRMSSASGSAAVQQRLTYRPTARHRREGRYLSFCWSGRSIVTVGRLGDAPSLSARPCHSECSRAVT